MNVQPRQSSKTLDVATSIVMGTDVKGNIDRLVGILNQLSVLTSKSAKQAMELKRLHRHIEQLEADKRNLNFDLNKTRAEIAQLKGA